MALVNVPVPVPLLVFVVNATVGFVAVDQQMPRAVTDAPPPDVTLPPPVPPVDVMPVIGVVVVTTGATAADVVVNVTFAP